MIGTDEGIRLTAPFTEVTSLKGQQIKNKTCSWVKTQNMENAVGRVRGTRPVTARQVGSQFLANIAATLPPLFMRITFLKAREDVEETNLCRLTLALDR
jgi:hypothetical protein